MWQQVQTIDGNMPGVRIDVDDHFGSSLALSESGNVLAVGAEINDTDNIDGGIVYVFAKDNGCVDLCEKHHKWF